MATSEQERLREELSVERKELAGAVESLRAKLRSTAKTVGVGLAVAGGVKTAVRLLSRRK